MSDASQDSGRKKTILIVDDSNMERKSLKMLFQYDARFADYNIETTATLIDAMVILADPKRQISAVVTDNGFYLTEQGLERGKEYRKGTDREEDGKIADNISKEGSAGMMLLRFMNSGKTGAKVEPERNPKFLAELKKISDLEDNISRLYPDRAASLLQRLRDVPVIWASGDVEEGKIKSLELAARGELIPNEPEYKVDKIADNPSDVHEIPGTSVAWTGKPINFGAMMDYVAKSIEKHENPYKDLPVEQQFMQAVKDSNADALESLKEKHGSEIPTSMISAAIGHIASSEDYPKTENLLAILIDFPHANPNSSYTDTSSGVPELRLPLSVAVEHMSERVVQYLLDQTAKPIKVNEALYKILIEQASEKAADFQQRIDTHAVPVADIADHERMVRKNTNIVRMLKDHQSEQYDVKKAPLLLADGTPANENWVDPIREQKNNRSNGSNTPGG